MKKATKRSVRRNTPGECGQVRPLRHAAAGRAATLVVAAPGEAAVRGDDDGGGTEAPETVADVDAAVVACVGGARAVGVALEIATGGELSSDGPFLE